MSTLPENDQPQLQQIKEYTSQGYEIRRLTPDDAAALYEIEIQNWAPWIQADEDTLRGRSKVCPEGQIGVWDGDKLVAALSLARFQWDKNPDNLPTWDQLAETPEIFNASYKPDGNAVVMISMNVHPAYQGQRLPQEIIKYVQKVAPSLGITHVLGSFRPNQYWEWSGGRHPDEAFEQYCETVRTDGKYWDAWLRNLEQNGMAPIKVQKDSMVVKDVPIAQFNSYRNAWHPERWRPLDSGLLDKHNQPRTWICGELGVWEISEDDQTATYREPNLWGKMKNGEVA